MGVVAIAFWGCQNIPDNTPKWQRYQYTQLHLGVQVRIVVFAEKRERAEEAGTAAFNRIAELEDIFSNYRANSELSLLATTAYTKSIQVSDELFYVINESVNFSEQTSGAFDITLGPMIENWKKARSTGELPTPEEIAHANTRAGWKNITLDEVRQTVKLGVQHMQLDVGGIAKGYILDEALKTLAQHQVHMALLEAGGDIVVGAPPPGKSGWQVKIPGAPATSDVQIIANNLKHAAIATSGDTEQFVEIEGTRYSHIVDPRTGFGSTSQKLATVIAPNGMTADKLATTLTILKKPEADSLLQAFPDVLVRVRSSK